MINSATLDEGTSEEDDKSIKQLLNNIIDRITFFSSFYKKLEKINELPRVYDGFLRNNLLDLYKFAEVFKIHNDLNEFNPFCIWARSFNGMRHLDVEREISRNDVEFAFGYKSLDELKYQHRKEYKNVENMLIVLKLKMQFYNDIANGNSFVTEHLLISKKIAAWNKIKDFLLFILHELPKEKILLDNSSDFYTNRSHLGRFYIAKANKKSF